MANEILKQVFQEMHLMTAASVNPDAIMDALFSKNVIVSDDYDRLHHVPVPRDRSRKLFSLLHQSSHPQAFIHLRLALLDEYPWIVDKIDKFLTSRLQQLRSSHSADGKCVLYRLYKSVCVLIYIPQRSMQSFADGADGWTRGTASRYTPHHQRH